MDQTDRVSPTLRPRKFAIGHQRWNDLLLLSWEVPLSQLRPLVPDELEIDTFNGSALVSIVPFSFSRVRAAFMPPLPFLSSFPEVNVRTYVHHRGRNPGIWLLRVDAVSALAVVGARVFFDLPFHVANVRLTRRTGGQIDVESQHPDASMRVTYAPRGDARQAAVETLDHFIAERYIIYFQKQEALFCGRIHHPAHALRDAEVQFLDENLLQAAGVLRPMKPPLVHFSRCVDVETFRPERVRTK